MKATMERADPEGTTYASTASAHFTDRSASAALTMPVRPKGVNMFRQLQ